MALTLELTHGPHSPRFIELQKLIPVQERLVRAKLDGDPIFDRVGTLRGNLEQVRAGLAWHQKKYQGEQTVADRVAYSDAEMDARRHERGLWSDRDQVPPWDYRTAEREQKKAQQQE